ncbi:hypothetical protein GCM10027256_38380 [Novispirillum itersonii subsp. nipponicum]
MADATGIQGIQHRLTGVALHRIQHIPGECRNHPPRVLFQNAGADTQDGIPGTKSVYNFLRGSEHWAHGSYSQPNRTGGLWPRKAQIRSKSRSPCVLCMETTLHGPMSSRA